jgi:23S rRNA (guanine745-N1)-methyltransferase
VDPRDQACLDDTLSPAVRFRALAAVAAYLRCPVCAGELRPSGARLTCGRLVCRRLACGRNHSFDIARHGYVNLTAGRAGPGTGDTAAMVAARDTFLSRGHYRPLAEALRVLAVRHDPSAPGLVADLAGGTGHYLSGVLEALPHRHGVCLDLSVPALRRAVRSHPWAAAVGADIWQPLPLVARSVALALSIFGPRNAAETGRVLGPGGALIMAVPGPAHLGELRRPLGIIGIDKQKLRRIAGAYRDYALSDLTIVNYQLSMDHADLAALVTMGPSARHISPESLATRIRALPSPVAATVEVQFRVFQRRERHARP